jgi:hypothetical protein
VRPLERIDYLEQVATRIKAVFPVRPISSVRSVRRLALSCLLVSSTRLRVRDCYTIPLRVDARSKPA